MYELPQYDITLSRPGALHRVIHKLPRRTRDQVLRAWRLQPAKEDNYQHRDSILALKCPHGIYRGAEVEGYCTACKPDSVATFRGQTVDTVFVDSHDPERPREYKLFTWANRNKVQTQPNIVAPDLDEMAPVRMRTDEAVGGYIRRGGIASRVNKGWSSHTNERTGAHDFINFTRKHAELTTGTMPAPLYQRLQRNLRKSWQYEWPIQVADIEPMNWFLVLAFHCQPDFSKIERFDMPDHFERPTILYIGRRQQSGGGMRASADILDQKKRLAKAKMHCPKPPNKARRDHLDRFFAAMSDKDRALMLRIDAGNWLRLYRPKPIRKYDGEELWRKERKKPLQACTLAERGLRAPIDLQEESRADRQFDRLKLIHGDTPISIKTVMEKVRDYRDEAIDEFNARRGVNTRQESWPGSGPESNIIVEEQARPTLLQRAKPVLEPNRLPRREHAIARRRREIDPAEYQDWLWRRGFCQVFHSPQPAMFSTQLDRCETTDKVRSIVLHFKLKTSL
jgi:hypothetical protein